MNATEGKIFDKYKKAKEKIGRIKLRLDRIIAQTYTICALYTYVLACRALATNYALFLLEQYLMLKIKAVRVGKSIELKIVEDFINCCK